MFFSKLKKTNESDRINLNSAKRMVPLIVPTLPYFGNKKADDEKSSDSQFERLYLRPMPHQAKPNRHGYPDSNVEEYMKLIVGAWLRDWKVKECEVKTCYSAEHGESLIIVTELSSDISDALVYLEEIVNEDEMDLIAQDLQDIRVLEPHKILSRSITPRCHIARRQECLIITFPGCHVAAMK